MRTCHRDTDLLGSLCTRQVSSLRWEDALQIGVCQRKLLILFNFSQFATFPDTRNATKLKHLIAFSAGKLFCISRQKKTVPGAQLYTEARSPSCGATGAVSTFAYTKNPAGFPRSSPLPLLTIIRSGMPYRKQ